MNVRVVPASMFLLFIVAACHSAEVAPALTLSQAAQALSQESGAHVRDYSTRDFGREKFDGARSVVVPVHHSLEILSAVRSRLGAGFIAFIGTQSNLTEPTKANVEIVVAPGKSQFDILRIAATDAANYDMYTEDLIRELRSWDEEFGIDIYAAQSDLVQLRLRRMPKDLGNFAKRVYKFCPDIVDQGTGTVEELENAIAKDREVALWWD